MYFCIFTQAKPELVHLNTSLRSVQAVRRKGRSIKQLKPVKKRGDCYGSPPK